MSIVAKFGGSSVGSPERLKGVAEIIRSHPEYTGVVVSAYEGVTNALITIAHRAAKRDESSHKLFGELQERHVQTLTTLLPPALRGESTVKLLMLFREGEDLLQGISLLGDLSLKTLDQLMSLGERASALTLTAYLNSLEIPSTFLDTREVIVTDAQFGGAKVNFEVTNKKILDRFKGEKSLLIATGFIAATAQGDTTTLGRGGSDYTGSILGSALNSNEIHIWTDVNGVMTADPRKVSRALSLLELSYEETLELCHFGAKVIYPPSLQPAFQRKIPIRVLNTFSPTFPGTVISETRAHTEGAVTGISSIPEVSLVQLEGNGMIGVAGIAGRLFSALALAQVNVILISQASSEFSICCAVSPADADRAAHAIDEAFSLEIKTGILFPTHLEAGCSVVSVVGENMRMTPGVSGTLFEALGKGGVNIKAIAQGSSERNISVVIGATDEKKALNIIHDAFFPSLLRPVHLFLVGKGLIGGTLLKQIESHRQNLERDLSLDLRLVGLATRKGMYFESGGLSAVKTVGTPQPYYLSDFVAQIKELNLASSVFIDCTASEEVADIYGEVLGASIPIVTPNKRAQSGPLSRYHSNRKTAEKRGVEWLYETSVGASLPVISTLQDLVRSGDKVRKIQGVLSGTLSFIFNSFAEDKNRSFSELVLLAKERGFTEPDPRDDLSGLDVARKLLILARETGAPLELSDVVRESAVTHSLMEIPSVEAFFKALPSLDGEWNLRRNEASARNGKLSYVATYELLPTGESLLTAKVQEINGEHPLYSLSGSDNSIAFTTERYSERPLVVRGPGAGAEVTAAGVFADIIRIARGNHLR